MVRVYFNFRDAKGGLIWSVDDGDQKNEVNVKRIVVECPLESVFDPNAKRGIEPSGYFVALDGKYWIDLTTQTAFIFEK